MTVTELRPVTISVTKNISTNVVFTALVILIGTDLNFRFLLISLVLLFWTNQFISKKVQTVAHAIMSLANHTARMKMSLTPNVSTKIRTSKKFAEILAQISKSTFEIYIYMF